jgi:N-acetylglucosaminyldiphosphoundecaprenol N-acetyl-beta-D-mannosaminyltransferase
MAGQLLSSQSVQRHPCFSVLGVRVEALQFPEVVAQMEKWIHDHRGCHSIACTGMHGVVEAQHDLAFRKILEFTDLVVPDGMPLIWLGRRRGHDLPHRVYAPDLVLAFCEQTQGQAYRHFFYGGDSGVADRLAESLTRRFPGMRVAGTYSPPFRPLSEQEDDEIVAMISRAAPDVLWVGLGAPKQERWMHEHKQKLSVPVMVSVGAAFDWLSGRRRQAPPWMREHGLEWLFRLLQEPRRLWRRYLVYGVQFLFYLALESLKLKKFGPDTPTSTL